MRYFIIGLFCSSFLLANVVDPTLFGQSPEKVFQKTGKPINRQETAKRSKPIIKQAKQPPQELMTMIKPAELISVEYSEDSIIDTTSYFKKGPTKMELLSGTIIIGRLQETIDTRFANIPFTIMVKNDVYTNQNQIFFNSGDKIVGDIKLIEDNGTFHLELIPKKAIINRLSDEIVIDEAIAIPANNERLNELGAIEANNDISTALLTDLWNTSIKSTNLEIAEVAKDILGIGNQKKKPVITINAGQLIMIKLGKRLAL